MSDESESAKDENKAHVTPIILVVEDDQLTRKAVSRRLQAEGYEIVAVPSAADALIAAQRLPFHVLVLDLNLVTEDDPFSGIHEGLLCWRPSTTVSRFERAGILIFRWLLAISITMLDGRSFWNRSFRIAALAALSAKSFPGISRC